MSYKDEILQTLFGGGYLDYEMLDKCKYDFEDVLNKINIFTTIGEMDFNDILIGAFDIFKENIYRAIDNKKEELRNQMEELENQAVGNDSENQRILFKTTDDEYLLLKEELEKIDKLNIFDDVEIFTNYLDTHIYFNCDKEIEKIYFDYFQDVIEEENEKIGFVSLEFNNFEN